ncbi:MAG: molybdopterin adenylyltransferase [Betaproteobacteria bacterium]|nr:molybdopterin adenylyltransferase [Betaproteobacteria bacterium]
MNDNTICIGILTVSDRASSGEYEDKGGPAIHDWLTQAVKGHWETVARVIPDDEVLIEATLRELSDREGCCLIVTTGGTGPSPRDVTPEATENVCSKMLPGFGELMRSASLASVPTAILSRQTAGIRGQSLIINLPGKPAAIAECLQAVFPAVPYCIDLIGGAYIETHPDFCAAFRPAGARRGGN